MDPKKFKLTFDVIRDDEDEDEGEDVQPMAGDELPDGCRVVARFS